MDNPTTEPIRATATPQDFIRTIVSDDVKEGRNGGRVATRFPPEPNGYLHIGHAKSICLNFGVAQEFGGTCNLRFDDTNPTREDVEYVESIEEDVRWLGFEWNDRPYFASDYFERLYGYAVHLIEKGLAYVDSLSAEEMRALRGTLTEAGKPSPDRDRSVAENLDLFARMRAGEFADGAMVLRAKIDMTSPNINLRDPVLYRIRRAHHHRTGDAWCIYPMYDFAHPPSDALEHITHSLCTLEFEDHRPLYDWLIENLPVPSKPRQIEFARLNLSYTVMSKRRLLELVEEKHVSGWDDPRMPTIVGMRRRGYTPEAIRTFCDRIGVAKRENMVDVALLEHAVREDLNRRAPRVMAVLDPIKVVIENYPENETRGVLDHQQPGRRRGRLAPGALLAGALHRARRLSRGSAEEVLSPEPRPRSAAARRLLHHLHRRREGSGDRRGRRAALHLRSGDARRRRARRPQGEVDAALGLGGRRARRRGSPLRSVRSRARRPARRATTTLISTLTRSRCSAAAGSSRASPAPCRARAISSSGSDTSPSIPIRPPTN